MSERDIDIAHRQQVLKIVAPYLDKATLAIVESALAADERMAVIRDAFLEGRDHEAVHMIRALDPVGRWVLLPCSTMMRIEPTQSVQITCRPQHGPFDPCHLLVSRSCADFLLNDVRVRNRSQFLQSGDVPLDPFVVDAPALDVLLMREADAGGETPINEEIVVKINRSGSQLLGVRLDIEPVDEGGELVLVVTNNGTAPAPFLATWLGQQHWVRKAPMPTTL